MNVYFAVASNRKPPKETKHKNMQNGILHKYASAFQLGMRSRSRKELDFLSGVGFLTTPGVGFSCPTPTPDVQLDHFLHHTAMLGIPVEMVNFF